MPEGQPRIRTLGKYSLLREVGRGGMGVVFEAVDTQLNRKVALKILVPRALADKVQAEQERQRFNREASLAAQLKHPNIVTVFEAGELQGKRFLAMEFIQGKPFFQWWLQKSLKLKQKVEVLRDVALAVDYAHQQGILHRDLKPANILIDSAHKPYVMDFGLAKAMDSDTGVSLTSDGMVVGTPSYMSPEQARGLKNVDARTDVYAMGVTLYEIISGRKPFEGETALEILMKASKERVQPPSSVSMTALDASFDRTLENICLKALARNPAERYASAQAFAQDLTRWLKGEAVRIVPPSVTRRRVRPASRPKTWTLAAAAGGILLLGLLAFLLLPGSAPSVDLELARGRQYMKEKKYTEARIEFGKALAKEAGNAEALAGDREARAAEEKDRARQAEEKKLELQRALEAAQGRSERETKEAEAKARAAGAAASESEQKQLLAELETIKERARKAEEEAKRTKENLARLESERAAAVAAPPPPTPAPAPVPAPKPPPPDPVPAPRPPPPPKPAKPPADPAALRDAAALALDRFDFKAAFAAIDQLAEATKTDSVAEKVDALRKAKKLVKAREDAAALAAAHLQLAADAAASDDLNAALQSAKDAASIAKQAGDVALADQAAAAQKEIQAVRPLFDRFAKAQKTLATAPGDAAASLDAGRYLCLIKDRWDDGLSLLAAGSEAALKDLAAKELARPAEAPARIALGDGWLAVARKESVKPVKDRMAARALFWYDEAMPDLRGIERLKLEKKVEECLRLAPLETKISFVPDQSMKLFAVGTKLAIFPEQKTDDATGPFRNSPVYFDQKSGTDAVWEIRSGRKFRQVYWKGAAMTNLTLEVLDLHGTVLGKGGPFGGGNQWGEFTVDFTPVSRFYFRLRNHAGSWVMVDTIEVR